MMKDYLVRVEDKIIKVESKLKNENNMNVNLRTQLNYLLQTQFNVDEKHKKLQRINAKSYNS